MVKVSCNFCGRVFFGDTIPETIKYYQKKIDGVHANTDASEEEKAAAILECNSIIQFLKS